MRLWCAPNGSIFKCWNSTELGEVIAANRLELIPPCLRYRRPTRLSRRFNLPKCFDVDADNCKRKAGMASLDRLVQPLWEFALPGHGAVPLAFIVGDAAYLPKRQFQIDQCERRFGQGTGINQLIELGSIPPSADSRRAVLATISESSAGVASSARLTFPARVANCSEWGEMKEHDVLPDCTWTAPMRCGAVPKMRKQPFEFEWERGPKI
jgi:hypothetical protein